MLLTGDVSRSCLHSSRKPVGSAGLTFDDDLYYELCDLMYRRLFGVLDEITNMTRSLKMVDRQILIYRTMVFGHRKCFGWYQVLIGSPKWVPGSPGRFLGLMGQNGKSTSAHKGMVRPSNPCPHTKGGREGKGRRPKAAISLFLSPSCSNKERGSG